MQEVLAEPTSGGLPCCLACSRQRQIRLFLESASSSSRVEEGASARSAAAVAAAVVGIPAFAAAAGVRLSECIESLWNLPPLKALSSLSGSDASTFGNNSQKKPRRQLQPRSSQRLRPVSLDISSAGGESPLLKQCCANLGWRIADSFFAAADIHWFGNALSDEAHQSLSSVVVNRLPFASTVSRKRWICLLLSSLSELEPERFDFYPRTVLLPEGLREFYLSFERRRMQKPPPSLQNALAAPPTARQSSTFVSSTFASPPSVSSSPCTSREEKRGSFNRCNEEGGVEGGSQRVWILKPDGGAQGSGLRIVCSPNDLPEALARGSSQEGDLFIAQEYVANPLLLNDRKFDLRVYVLVLEVHPTLRVFVSRRGLVRFCAEEYRVPRLCNCGAGGIAKPHCRCDVHSLGRSPYSHFTNFAVNKAHKDFKRPDKVHDPQASKRLLEDVLEELETLGVEAEDVWRQLLQIVSKTVRAMAPLLSLKYRMLFPPSVSCKRSRCFQLLGFDLLLDASHKLWLLEVNANPSLRSDVGLDGEESVVDQRVKEPLVGEALLLAYLALIKPSQTEAKRALASSLRSSGCRCLAKSLPLPPKASVFVSSLSLSAAEAKRHESRESRRKGTHDASQSPAQDAKRAAIAARSEKVKTRDLNKQRSASCAVLSDPPPWPASDDENARVLEERRTDSEKQRLSPLVSQSRSQSRSRSRPCRREEKAASPLVLPCVQDAPFVSSPVSSKEKETQKSVSLRRTVTSLGGGAAYKARVQRSNEIHERQLQLLEREHRKLRLRRRLNRAEQEETSIRLSSSETLALAPSPQKDKDKELRRDVSSFKENWSSSVASSTPRSPRDDTQSVVLCSPPFRAGGDGESEKQKEKEAQPRSSLSFVDPQSSRRPSSSLNAEEEEKEQEEEKEEKALQDAAESPRLSSKDPQNTAHGTSDLDRVDDSNDEESDKDADEDEDGNEAEREVGTQNESVSALEKKSNCFSVSQSTLILRGKGGSKVGKSASLGCCTYSAAARSTEAGESLIASSGLSSAVTQTAEGFGSSFQSERATSSAFPVKGTRKAVSKSEDLIGEELSVHCCLWQPVSVEASDVQTAPSAALLLLAECTDIFVELTRFPQERVLSWQRWVAFVRHAGLDALVRIPCSTESCLGRRDGGERRDLHFFRVVCRLQVARLSVPVVLVEGLKGEMDGERELSLSSSAVAGSTARRCRRFAQRPLCMRDLVLLHSKILRPSESAKSRAASSAAASVASAPSDYSSNAPLSSFVSGTSGLGAKEASSSSFSSSSSGASAAGLGVWGFWKLVRVLAAALHDAIPPCACLLQTQSSERTGCGRLCAGDSWTLTSQSRFEGDSSLRFFDGPSSPLGVNPKVETRGTRRESEGPDKRDRFGGGDRFEKSSSRKVVQSASGDTRSSSLRRLVGVPPLLLHRSISDVSGIDTEEELSPRSERLSPRVQLAKRAFANQQFSEAVAAAAAAASSGANPGSLFPPFFFVKRTDPSLWKQHQRRRQQPTALTPPTPTENEHESAGVSSKHSAPLLHSETSPDATKTQVRQSGSPKKQRPKADAAGDEARASDGQTGKARNHADGGFEEERGGGGDRRKMEEKNQSSQEEKPPAQCPVSSSRPGGSGGGTSHFFLRWWPKADVFYRTKTPAERLECMRKTLSFLRFKAKAFAKDQTLNPAAAAP